ncbi:spore germination protein GerPE [Paenibacillus pasadenensis]|uniref:spore germination protein GerPE n=1 Tax=Paenibacillus pasadenensis TaxID=217090 RepID=UPI0020404D24|nr:spore germination protein GerPE [Paenibacillus pasadenensis]MCM3747265.1 spore germination protein GerPE [Paenibacillus pasadenensis]
MIDSDASIRTAYIGSVELISIGLSSVVQFGDTGRIHSRTKVLAVQRQLDHRVGGEVEFDRYPLFYKPFAQLKESADAADVRTIRTNPTPGIQVGSVSVIAYSSAAVMLTGNAVEAELETRLKHFRQFAYALSATSASEEAISELIVNAEVPGSEAEST